MRRLGVRLVLAFVGVTLLTMGLMAAPLVTAIVRENGALPPGERARFGAGDLGRRLLFEGRVLVGDGWTAVLTPRAAGARELQSAVGRAAVVRLLRDSLEQRAASLAASGLLALVVAVVLALVLARVIAGPVERVTRAAGRVAAGDLSVRLDAPAEAGAGAAETTRLAQSFNAMADALERLEANRKALVADVAHELRTPLTIMRGRLEAVEDGVVPLTMDEVRDLHAQVLALGRLVDDLRTLSLADAGELSVERVDVDLRELALQVVAGVQVAAGARDVTLEVRGDGPVRAFVDPDRMRQVMLNLLDNALRHSPAGGRVTLSVEGAPPGACFSVRDEGPGLEEGTEARIFERFVRGDPSRARSGGGSGLGLAIVSSLVSLHGGTVTATNAPGGGALFTVRL
ncbi:MAG: HAMP domain-containing protein [Trueperaceae bacterium]|nr:HAMP domain-containing protein [Trueperaceae bacterium]